MNELEEMVKIREEKKDLIRSILNTRKELNPNKYDFSKKFFEILHDKNNDINFASASEPAKKSKFSGTLDKKWNNFIKGEKVRFWIFQIFCILLDLHYEEVIERAHVNSQYDGISLRIKKIAKLAANKDWELTQKYIIDYAPDIIKDYDFDPNIDTFTSLGDLSLKAILTKEKLIELGQNIDPDLLIQLGSCYNREGKYFESLCSYQEAFNYSNKGELQEIRSLMGIVENNLNLGKYVESIDHISKLKEKIQCKQSQYDNFLIEADIYLSWNYMNMNMKNYDISRGILEKLNQKIQEEDNPLKPSIYHFIARNILSTGKNPEHSLSMLMKQKKSLSLNSKIESHKLGHCYRWISENYLKLNKIDESKRNLNHAKDLFSSDKYRLDHGGQKFISYHEAKIYLAQGNIKRAYEILEESKNNFENINYKKGIEDCKNLLTQIKRKINRK
jgi:tetratricopeptide (TPR) repeat protein